MNKQTESQAAKVAAPVGGHTAGPWFAGESFNSFDVRQRVTPIYARDPDVLEGRWLVAWCHHNATPAKQRKYNARLIAAAPELLEACKGLLEVVANSFANRKPVSINCPEAGAAMAAIARATGAAS